MAGLVGYDSSDDDDGGGEGQRPAPDAAHQPGPASSAPAPETGEAVGDAPQDVPSSKTEQPAPPRHVIGPVPQSAVPLGPSLPSPQDAAAMSGEGDDEAEAPPSPYSANRALIHHLTLPSVPNLDIPPSPPGSPPARVSKGFEEFLALKRKGTHFNAKLEQSTALKNPSIMDKLMNFVGLDMAQQYETTLSPDLWNPMAFPETAYGDNLRKSRERLATEKEADKSSGGRTSVDFVPSSSITSDGTVPLAGGLTKRDRTRSSWR
ncbi:hypothetical protein CDD83_11170 [Cordyceps sp. RAO-2017]|nr:hypothetical protein CDD83_11170 [Cordyceps sp. RAO-2017]